MARRKRSAKKKCRLRLAWKKKCESQRQQQQACWEDQACSCCAQKYEQDKVKDMRGKEKVANELNTGSIMGNN